MGYENLEIDSLVTLEVALSRAAKVEKNEQTKKDFEYELKRVKEILVYNSCLR